MAAISMAGTVPLPETTSENCMAKEEMLEFDGTVTEVLPDGNYRVKLDNDHVILAYAAGKMKKHRIRTLEGDRVIVEMSPYDLDRGRSDHAGLILQRFIQRLRSPSRWKPSQPFHRQGSN